MGILDVPGYSRSQADARFAPVALTSRTIVLGDSIDAATVGWFPYYAVQSKRIRMVRNAGVGGERTDQMLARIQADVLAYNPDIVILGGSTNDQGQGIAPATTKANIRAMVQAVFSIGALPILRTTPPVDVAGTGAFSTISTRRDGVMAHNTWIREYASSLGLDVLDIYQSVVDPATGGYAAGITSDGIHPTEVGYKAIADYLLGLPIPAAFKGGFPLARTVTDPSNLLPNGVFVGDSDANGRANSWLSSGGTPTWSLTAGGTGVTGNWQRITTSTSASGGILQDLTTGFTAGDTIAMTGRVRTSGTGTALVRFTFTGGGVGVDPIASTTQAITDGVFYREQVVPSGTTAIRVTVQQSTAAGWVEVAEMAVRNLTTIGT